jgi:thiamine-phosphate pyrophosphorylase
MGDRFSSHMKPITSCRLYGILDTGYVAPESMHEMARMLIMGGIDILQLRAKKQSAAKILEMALELSPLCHKAGIPFILNDHPELVREAGADGAHVGQDDMSIVEARRLAGPGSIIGKSTHSPEQARKAISEAPDYIGFGPLFATPTKPDYTPIGTEQIRQIHAELDLPIFCIGGIKLSNLRPVLDAGARRVVIVSDLLAADNPVERTASCKALLEDIKFSE